jgi:transposase
MPWKGAAMSEQRQRSLEDYRLRYYTVSELAERVSISRKTAHRWIDRFEKQGQEGFHEDSLGPTARPGRPIQRSSRSSLRCWSSCWILSA